MGDMINHLEGLIIIFIIIIIIIIILIIFMSLITSKVLFVNKVGKLIKWRTMKDADN